MPKKDVGTYELVSWREGNVTKPLGLNGSYGTMIVEPSGRTRWVLSIKPFGQSASARSRIQCQGELSAPNISGVPGGGNVATDWDGGLKAISESVWLAFCGLNKSGTEAPFRLSESRGSDGRELLVMSNSKGTYTWQKIATGGTSDLKPPRQSYPASNAELTAHSRAPVFTWKPVLGANSYTLEIEQSTGRGWSRMNTYSGLSENRFKYEAQFRSNVDYRWRVWAVDSLGVPGRKSRWSEFRYK